MSKQLKQPSVSILIPAYNRVENLRKTLGHLTPSVSEDVEIVVVDDCSSNSSVYDICQEYSQRVRYVKTPHNSGVIGARNFGCEIVSGEILIHLDDDSYFDDPSVIDQTIQIFRENPSVGVIAYNISSPGRGLVWKTHLRPFCIRTYVGCGNAWRLDAIRKAGGFYSGFWRQGEEVEHSMRVYDAGYEVWALPSAKVFHDESLVNRDRRKFVSLEAANYLKRIILRVPRSKLPFAFLRWLGFLVIHSSRLSIAQVYFELSDKERGLFRTYRDRLPISTRTYNLVEKLKRIELIVKSPIRRRSI